MRSRLSHTLALFIFSGFLAAVPVSGAAAEVAPEAQTITIHDTRGGDGPCGFTVERTIEGTVKIVPRIDEEGNLILTIAPVALEGTLVNPDNGKAVVMRWVRPNGVLSFGQDGKSTTVAWAVDGHFSRGYEIDRTDLSMRLPADGADIVAFEPGVNSTDPWSHVCGLLG
jgi:hypothetical protein